MLPITALYAPPLPRAWSFAGNILRAGTADIWQQEVEVNGEKHLAIQQRAEWDHLVWKGRDGSVTPAEFAAAYSAIQGLILDGSHERLAMMVSSSQIPPRIIVWTFGTSTTELIYDSLPQLPQDLALASPQRLQWLSTDQLEVSGLYYRPPLVPDSTALPTIILLHDGPAKQVRASWPSKAHFFNARGWAVLYVNYRGSLGYGPAFSAALNMSKPEQVGADAASGAAHLCSLGLAIPTELVLFGGGWAGARVIEAIAAPASIFKAGISVYPTLPDSFCLVPQRPLVLFHGAKDQLTPISSSRRFIAAAKAAGAPATLIEFANEGHGWTEAATRLAYYEAIMAFITARV